MSIGRGFPLWRPAPPSQPEAHKEKGFSIGDVGCLDDRGGFQYWFNIFYPRDHPVQDDVPLKFKPIEPPMSEWKIQVSANDLSPGTILCSQGISASHITEQPLYVSSLIPSGLSDCNLFPQAKLNLRPLPEKEAFSFFRKVLLVKILANPIIYIPTWRNTLLTGINSRMPTAINQPFGLMRIAHFSSSLVPIRRKSGV